MLKERSLNTQMLEVFMWHFTMTTLKRHERQDNTARVVWSHVDLMYALVLLLFRPRCGPRLELCNARILFTDLHRDRLSRIEIDAHGPDSDPET